MNEEITDQDPALYDDIPEDDGVLQPADTLDTDDLDADPLDTGISPRERHPASEGFGVTAAEAQAGESLDQRLAQEEPDVDATGYTVPDEAAEADEFAYGDEPAQPRTGRLLAADEGSHPTSDPTYFVRDVGIDGGAAGAEEAAVHVIEDDDLILAEDPEAGYGDDFDEDLD
jgi:hypothetical protein